MTGFASFMAAAGMVARVPQEVFAEAVADRLRPGEPVAVAAQAATGIGKTWALAFAAVEAAGAGRRVIWSTHTTLLRAQVLATLRHAVAAAGVPVVVHERRGRTDYPSAVRTRRLRHARKDAGADADELAQLDALAVWQEPIAAFVAAYGDLRVPESLVRLMAACPDAEQVVYRSQRDAVEDARIVMQTHALTLIEARFNRLRADLVIFDEADTLASVAAGAVEARLVLDDLETLAVAMAVDVAEPVARLRERATDGSLVWRDAAMVAAVEAIRTALAKNVTDLAPELAQAVTEIAADLRHFATVDAPKT
jgi:Rad3-related DNA helicase